MIEQTRNPLLISEPPPVLVTTGREGRSSKRLRKKYQVHERMVLLIKERLPCLAYSPYETGHYDNQLEELLINIDDEFPSSKERIQARNYLARFVTAGNQQKMWDLAPPLPVIQLKRHGQLRTLKWHHSATTICNIIHKLEHQLEIPDSLQELQPEELLALLVLTAPSYGGLCDNEAVLALVKHIAKGSRIESGKLFGQNLTWVDLVYNSSRIHNTHVDDKVRRIKRWFIDTVSLGIVHHYLSREQPSLTDADYNSTSLLKFLGNSLNKLGIKQPYSTLREACQYSASVAESLPEVELSSAIIGTLNDKNLTVSLPTEFWASLITPVINDPGKISYKDFIVPTLNKGGTGRTKSGKKEKYFVEIDLYNAIKVDSKSGKKLTPHQALHNLCNLDTSNWSEHEICLLNWYKVILEDSNLKASTVRRYHHAAASIWLYVNEELGLAGMDGEEAYQAYQSQLAIIYSEKSQAYNARALDTLHRFAVDNYNYTPLVEPLFAGRKNTPMVRSGYITFLQYKYSLGAIDHVEGLPQINILGLKTIVMIAYRTGMRIGEILKLRFIDIEPSREIYIFIRNNKYGDNKRFPSKRKIPLAALMTEDDFQLWNEYMQSRRILLESDSELVFCEEGNGYLPLSSQTVSSLASTILRNITGIEIIVFHHFRHSFLSNLQAIAENEMELAAQLTGYSRKQITEIQRVLFGRDGAKLKNYWSIACLAGHGSPISSLKSYMHFSDLISHLKLSRNKKIMKHNYLRSLYAVSQNKLTRLSADNKYPKGELSLELIRDYALQSIPDVFNHRILKTKHNDSPTSKSKVSHKSRQISHVLAYKALDDYQAGMKEQELTYKYGVPAEYIARWITNATTIAGLKTTKKHSRVISKHRTHPDKALILPTRLKSADEIKDAGKLIRKLREIYPKKKDDIKWIVDYFLTHSHTSSSGIKFDSNKELKRFIDTFSTVIRINRWRLIVKIEESESHKTRKQWQVVAGLKIIYQPVQSGTSKKLRSAYLHLKHPDEKKMLELHTGHNKYSAATLRYVLHMIGIMT